MIGVTVFAAFTVMSCSKSKESFEGAKSLMIEQIDQLGGVGTLDELMAVQVQNGDTIVELMTIIEPQLTLQEKDELQKLNQQYNNRLRSIADSLVQLTIIDSVTIVEEPVK